MTNYTVDKVQRAAKQLPIPWIQISNNEREIVVVVVENSMLKFRVSIKADFEPTFKVCGFSTPSGAANIENLKLNTFLTNLSCKYVCEGCDQ